VEIHKEVAPIGVLSENNFQALGCELRGIQVVRHETKLKKKPCENTRKRERSSVMLKNPSTLLCWEKAASLESGTIRWIQTIWLHTSATVPGSIIEQFMGDRATSAWATENNEATRHVMAKNFLKWAISLARTANQVWIAFSTGGKVESMLFVSMYKNLTAGQPFRGLQAFPGMHWITSWLLIICAILSLSSRVVAFSPALPLPLRHSSRTAPATRSSVVAGSNKRGRRHVQALKMFEDNGDMGKLVGSIGVSDPFQCRPTLLCMRL
jgi:hypothetical protein